MKQFIEASKQGDQIQPAHEVEIVCHNCGYDLDEAEISADTCADCLEPLNLRQSTAIHATSVPAAGARTMGQ